MTFEEIKISEVRKTTWKKNPISGHEWPEQGEVTGYEVTGGGFVRTKHKLLKYAEQEVAMRKAMLEKFPFLVEE